MNALLKSTLAHSSPSLRARAAAPAPLRLAATHGDARRNQLLASLAPSEWARWLPQLERVELAAGQVLYEYGRTPAHAIFPTTAIVSLTYTTLEGASAEFAVVGNDGMVGIALFMGGLATPSQAVVQSAGHGWRLPAHALRHEVDHAGAALATLLRYTLALIAQVAQTGACYRRHAIEQQLCRRLLMGLDRSTSRDLALTQEGVARLLGVRRESITAAAARLQRDGVIRYRRGRIEVLDRHGLEARSCECYRSGKREQQRLLPAALFSC